jgi:hypothetical protein
VSSWLDSERKGKCGANCYACPYYRVLCPGCITRICLVDRCIRGTSYTGITYPNAFCRLRAYCVVGKGVRPEPEPPPEVKTKSMARASLPQFTPIISTLDRRSWFWDTFPLPAICVRLGELMLNKGALRAASEKGLHDFLGYGGKIVLSTVMPDEVIDKLKPEDYLKAIADLRPDVAMIPDNYTYIDDPLYRSWSQTVRLVRYAGAFLDLEIPVLGLIKGAISRQVSWSIEKLAQMGYSSFAMPVRELAKARPVGRVSYDHCVHPQEGRGGPGVAGLRPLTPDQAPEGSEVRNPVVVHSREAEVHLRRREDEIRPVPGHRVCPL